MNPESWFRPGIRGSSQQRTDGKTTLPVDQNGEAQKTARVGCQNEKCDRVWEMEFNASGYYPDSTEDGLDAVVTCNLCKEETAFRLVRNAITTPGQIALSSIATTAAPASRNSLEVAARCFYANAGRALPGMCRSAIEEALDHKGIKPLPGDKNDLYGKIKAAKQAGILDDTHEMQATAARLIGRDTLHHQMQVTQVQALNMLTTSIDVVNHIAVTQP